MDTGLEQIQAAAKGDEAAIAALIARFMPAIRHCAVRAVRPGLEFDDAVQEGIIGLFNALSTYREDEAAGFDTYVNVCVRNAVADARRAATRKKHAPLNESVPLTEHTLTAGPETVSEQGEDVGGVLQLLRTRLSPMERSVLALYLQKQSYAQIAAQLHIAEKSVNNALQRIRAKLR